MADDEFPVSSYVDPAALEGPFYVGYVCLCFLFERIHVRRQNRPNDRRLTSRSRAQHHVKKKKKEAGREEEKERTSRLAGVAAAPPRPHRHREDRHLHGAFSALNMAIRFMRVYVVRDFFSRCTVKRSRRRFGMVRAYVAYVVT